MMPAATHFDPVVGVDVHMVQPSGPVPPTPIPHPYIGIVFDPFDYLPIIGSTVKINGIHRAIAGTAGKALPKHFPIGGTFVPPLPGDEHENFMGSSTVQMDHDAAAYMALPCLSCQSIGMPPPPRPSPKKKTKVRSLVLPTSIVLPIPKGAPVLIGGSPTISLFALAARLVGPLAKAIRKAKAFRKAGAAFRKARRRAFRNMKPGFLKCKILRAEPVDVVTGEVVVDQQDFELPGRIPIQWTRHYRSDSMRRGICGVGWETPADARLEIVADGVVFHDGTGVATSFDALPDVEPVLEPVDGGRLYRLERHYAVELKGGLTYYFELPAAPGAEILVAAIVGRCRNSLHFVRDRDGLREVVESAGRRLISFSEQGLLRSITLHHPDFPERRTLVRFAYDGDDNLTAVHDALDHPYTFGWDDRHRLVRHTNRTGLSFYYEYDAEGRCVHSWGDGGLYDYRFEYDPIGRFTNLTDSLGHPWTVEYDERLLITRETDPLGGVTSYAYDEVGRTTAVTDPMGHTTFYEYDGRGNLLKLTRPDGATIACDYDQNDRPIRTTDPNGAVWEQRWDERGLLVESRTPLGAVTAYAYDGRGQVTCFTNPRGAVTRVAFDAFDNLTALTNALGTATRFEHDALGNATARVDPLGHVTARDYDSKGRLIRTVLPSGATIECTHDADDNLVGYTDASGAVARFEYFGQGEVKKRIQPDGHCVEYHYDSEEQLVGMSNQRGETYHIERDALGRIVREVDYWGQARNYGYNAAGHLLRSVDPFGQIIRYATDPLGRIVRKVIPHPDRPNETFEESFDFDAVGNLVRAVNPHVIVTRQFDADGRLLEETQEAFVIRNSYDQNGNRVRRETSAGEVIGYQYDALDRVTLVRINEEPPIHIERDACGQIARELLGEHLARHYRYDDDGRITSQSIRCGKRWLVMTEFAYDLADNLTRRVDSDWGTDRYHYDSLDHLCEHMDPQGNLTRVFNDPAGHRLTTRIVGGGGRPASGGQSRVATGWNRNGHYQGADYSFDQAGNLVWRSDKERVIHFFWNVDQCLVRTDTNGVSTDYAYDPLGRRVFKGTNGCGIWFGWDGDALVAEGAVEADRKMTNADREQRQEYVYYPGTFTPLAQVGAGANGKQTLYFQNDPNGCPTRLINKEGETVWLARHGPLGGIGELLVERISNPIRLLGQYEDEETGLSYNRFRYFDPHIGQYISHDPLRLAASDNLYDLASNCFKYADPLGLRCWRIASEGDRKIIELINPFRAGTREAENLRDFVAAWNRVIGKNGGQMTTRTRPKSAMEKKYAANWTATTRGKDTTTYPPGVEITSSRTGKSHFWSPVVVGHVPDAGMGGPVAHNQWGRTVGETMPLYTSVNDYLAGVTSEVGRGTTYHGVRLSDYPF
jgi:RHS repeat-associated protein